jgi:hypothetical protein
MRYIMKRIIILIAFLTIALALPIDTAAKNINNLNGGVYFYSSLSPYGSWIEFSAGVTVWRPGRVSPGWAPYTEGYWEWTNDGWYWESNEPFGYITYHYGRWFYDDYYGWVWIPDNQWAPAWVEWRYDNDFIGWAPLPPYAGFTISFGINFTRRYNTPYGHWHFLRYKHMCDPYGYNYYIPSGEVYRFYSKTKYRTNYGYSNGRVINRGVNIDFVRTRGGRDIRERTIERVRDPNQIRNNDGRNSGRIRTYYPGRENITRENIDSRKLERTNRRTSLDYDKISIGRDRTLDRNNMQRDMTRDRADVRNDVQLRNRTNTNRNNTDGRTGINNQPNNRERNIEKRNENSRSTIERNRTITRPRNETPRVRNNQRQEKPQIRSERKNTRGIEKKNDNKTRKRIR